MTWTKICGISAIDDGRVALDAGADLLGFVFYPPSHRFIEPTAAAEIIQKLRAHRPTDWQAVGVVVNIPREQMNTIAERCSLDLIQVCGDEDDTYCRELNRPVIKTLTLKEGEQLSSVQFDPGRYGAIRILVDSHRPGMYGGTGQTSDW
ncbi:MAG: phosphoribosylanthranilate isomerase, partial [Chloroflexota bacterium]